MPSWLGPWFADDSPWRQPIPAACPVHPDTAPGNNQGMAQGYSIGTDYTSYDVHAFAYQVAQLTQKGDTNPSRDVRWCGPGQQENIIYSPTGQAFITVWIDTPTYKNRSLQVPMPFNWTGYNSPWDVTTAYYERRTTVVCQNGDLYYLYGVTPPGHPIRDNPTQTDTTWHASYGLKDAHGGWLGAYPTWGGGGSGFPPFAGIITPFDYTRTPVGGNFGHVLGGNVSFAARGSLASHPKWAWPAPYIVYGTHSVSDGRTDGIAGIPHGARIWWDLKLTDADFNAMGITKEWQLKIARTLRDYGLISKESVQGQGGAGGLISESVESIAWNIAHGYYPAGFQWPWMADGTTDTSDKDTTTYFAALPLAALPITGSRWKVADWNQTVPGITAPGTSTGGGGGGGGGGTSTISPIKEVLHSNTGSNPGSTITLTVANAPAAGNTLILSNMMNTAGFTVSSITDSKGNTWQIDEQATHPTSAITLLAASTMQNTGTLIVGDTIVLHLSGAFGGRYVSTVHEFSGVLNAVDATPSSGTATGTSRVAGSVTTTNANDLIWVAFGVAAAEAAFAPVGNYTSFAPSSYANSTVASLEFEYELGSVAATYSPSATGTSTPSLGIMVAYKAGVNTGGGGGGTQAYVQEVAHATANNPGASYAMTTTNGAAAGDLVVASVAIVLGTGSTVVSSVADAKGNTWHVDATETDASAGETISVCSSVLTTGLAATDTITFTFSSPITTAGHIACVAHEFSGYTNTIDTSAVNTSIGTTRNAGTATTTNANDLVWAAWGINGADSAFTPDGGWSTPATDFYANSTFTTVEFEYQIVAATGSYAATATGGSLLRSTGAVVAYKASTGGGGGGGGGGVGPQQFVQEIGHALVSPGAATYALAVASPPTAGDLIVLSVEWSDSTNTLTGVTDSKGNLWTVDAQVANPLTTLSTAVASTIQNNGTFVLGDTITLHFSGSVTRLIVAAHEYSGFTNTVDQTATNSGSIGTTRDAGTTATTTNANDLVVAAFGGVGTDTTFSPSAGYLTPPTDLYSNANGTLEFSYEIVTAIGAFHPTGTGSTAFRTCGVTVTYKAAPSGGTAGAPANTVFPVASGDATVGQTVSVTTGVWNDQPIRRGAPTTGSTNAAGTLTIPVPTGVVDGDVLVYAVAVDNPSNLPATPSGLTLLDSDATGPSAATYYRICDGTEPTSYSWTVADASAGTGRAYQSVNNTTPINAHSLNRTASSATATATSITTTVNNAGLIFAAMSGGVETSFGLVAGFVALALVSSASSAAASEETLQATAGATGAVSSSWDVAANNYAALIALAPAAATPSSFAYQWQRDNAGAGYTNIPGATSSTYTVVSADSGSNLRCVVTATNGSGSTSVDSNALGPVGANAPANTVAPVVSGTTTVGRTLSCTTGSWTDDGSPIFTYQWARDTLGDGVFRNLFAATNPTYTLVDADDGCNVKCFVTDTDSNGATQIDSNRVGPIVEPPPTNVSPPTIQPV